jgi:predicted RNA binding protein YcfA (HicA-like mRNA interferase family)
VPPLPLLSGSACIAVLAKIGYRSVRQKGSHVRLECPGRPPVTVPMHSEIDRGTPRSIIRTVEISVDEFVKLVG